MAVFAYLLGCISAAMGALLFLRVRSVKTIVLWIPKALAGSAATSLAGMGAVGIALGALARAPLALAAAAFGVLLPLQYGLRVTRHHDGFEEAFGADWRSRIPPDQQAHMLKRRWAGRLPSHPGVRCQRDVPFWTIPGTDRELLCDLWQPPDGVAPTGLAFLYFHGGAWHFTDKGFGTDALFSHLAAQGHVVMDVGYRLCPEVDVFEMVGDVKRAIVWIKTHAECYGIDPARVVVAGGSSGGHLALLAAYAPDEAELTPDDVKDADLSVQAVVAYYSMSDSRAVYQHFQSAFGGLGKEPARGIGRLLFRATGAVTRLLGVGTDAGTEDAGPSLGRDILGIGLFPWLMANLHGGSPDQVPRVYDLASPIMHAGPDSPPTLLLQGAHDAFLPAHVSRALHDRLRQAGVPSVYVEFPQSEHGFDLLLPRYAPAAQAALYDAERFLALMV